MDGELEWFTDAWPRDGKTILEQIAARVHRPTARRTTPIGCGSTPPGTPREVSHIFLGGAIDAFEADALLSEHGHEVLRLVDNGGIDRPWGGLGGLPPAPQGA